MADNLDATQAAAPPAAAERSGICIKRLGKMLASIPNCLLPIPTGLLDYVTIERILNDELCSPFSLHDFIMDCERQKNSESLYLYLWIEAYTERFDQAPESIRKMCAYWGGQSQRLAMDEYRVRSAATALKFDHTGRAKLSVLSTESSKIIGPAPKILPADSRPSSSSSQATKVNSRAIDSNIAPWDVVEVGSSQPPNVPRAINANITPWEVIETSSGIRASPYDIARATFTAAGLKNPYYHRHPFRQEITRIIATYLADDAPRQVNLDGSVRFTVLYALSKTTHPSAFDEVKKDLERNLRLQCYLNFIKHASKNANNARIKFAISVGIAEIVIAVAYTIFVILFGLSRGFRVFAAPFLFFSFATIHAASKGMCFILQGFHHRQLKPWELFAGDEEHTPPSISGRSALKKTTNDNRNPFGDDAIELSNLPRNSEDTVVGADTSYTGKGKGKAVTFGLNPVTAYESYPWSQYGKRTVIRKIFDRKTWVETPALRELHSRLFLQAIVMALLGTVILTGIIVSLPVVHIS